MSGVQPTTGTPSTPSSKTLPKKSTTPDKTRKVSGSQEATSTGAKTSPQRPSTPDTTRKVSGSKNAPTTPERKVAITEDNKRKASNSPEASSATAPNLISKIATEPPATPRLVNLVISAQGPGNGQVMVDGKNARYSLVEQIVRKALQIMESTEGIESLVKVATEFVRVSKEKKHAVTFESADTAGYTVAMKGFIKKLRDSFPNIYLEQSNLDGETLRYERPNIPRLANFEPRSSLALSMPRDIIANIMKAIEMDEPTTNFMFHMILSVCHEIIHMLVGALSGQERPKTPPEMTVSGHEDNKGESGWWWEMMATGGIVKMFQDKKSAMGDRQSGIPFLADKVTDDATLRIINKTYITEFVKENPVAGFKHFPIMCEKDPKTKQPLPPLPWATVKKQYGGPMSSARRRTRVIQNPSLNNSPEARKPAKAAKVAQEGTRKSTRTLPTHPKPQ